MRPATLLLVCVLPLDGCLGDPRSDADAPNNRQLTQFEEAVHEAACGGTHTAVALAAGPEELFWGTAMAAPTRERASALALARCRVRARLHGVSEPCSLYAVDGRPLYLEVD